MNLGSLIDGAVGSYFVAGAAGGLARSFYVKEAWAVSLMRTLAGGMSAHYITPIILWALPRFLEIPQEDLIHFGDSAGQAVAFATGMVGIFASTTFEKLVIKRLKL